MNLLLVLPIFLPLVSAAILLLIPSAKLQRWIHIAACLAHFAASALLLCEVLRKGITASQLGNWPAPFGITFVADTFSAMMVLITGLMGFLVAIYSLDDVSSEHQKRGFYSLYQVLLMGVSGAFLTGDLFNLFVWFEVMLMSSFVLLALGCSRHQLSGGVKYLVLNFLSSSLFLTALGLIYSVTGTLNMADAANILKSSPLGISSMSAAMLLMVSFGIKAGLFPLFAWLPASYHTPPVSVSAIFAALLTKVGVYALVRVFTLIFTIQVDFTHDILIGISLITMLTGVLGAAAQYETRKILSFHIISQIGYMTLGLGFFTEAALAATVFYIIHHIVVKTNLFLIAGAISKLKGTAELKKIGGLYAESPWLALLFLIPAMSLGGIPPLSGFFAKFALVKEGVSLHAWLSVFVALAVGILTLYSMTKIWAEAFWKASPNENGDFGLGDAPDPTPTSSTTPSLPSLPASFWAAITAMAAVTLAISSWPQWLFDLSERAAAELSTPSHYIQAVLHSKQ
ncbi:MAG: proton-conducting transporter membrane subunit [Chthoniobacterales bacterium]|nr:proton-conducting transporter membrane subunit [Chthoniobacterales bacterium]